MLLTVVQLHRSAGHDDQVSAFSFIFSLEILFHLLISKPVIEGLPIFNSNYLYSACANDTTFFLKVIIFIKHMVDTFIFCTFSD